jgi:Flp pilus assembly protein TadG
LTRRRQRGRGQALVEFALVLPIFLMLLLGVFDLGRMIYMYNGVAEAARELARVTSVHPGTPGALGSTTNTAAVLAAQKALVPSLGNPTFTCVDIDGSSVTDTCVAGMQVKVVIQAPFSPVTPVVSLLVGTLTLASSSTFSIQQ